MVSVDFIVSSEVGASNSILASRPARYRGLGFVLCDLPRGPGRGTLAVPTLVGFVRKSSRDAYSGINLQCRGFPPGEFVRMQRGALAGCPVIKVSKSRSRRPSSGGYGRRTRLLGSSLPSGLARGRVQGRQGLFLNFCSTKACRGHPVPEDLVGSHHLMPSACREPGSGVPRRGRAPDADAMLIGDPQVAVERLVLQTARSPWSLPAATSGSSGGRVAGRGFRHGLPGDIGGCRRSRG